MKPETSEWIAKASADLATAQREAGRAGKIEQTCLNRFTAVCSRIGRNQGIKGKNCRTVDA